MKGDTPLDYAEFQLTPRRTRCELLVAADGLMEKLASGFVKPFVTHLRAAEAQVARGNQVIRLETKPGYEKHSLHHHQSSKAWFCKGTIERFVRFVSTPEVIERVKTIEDELTQLEQVRSALVNTFAQAPDRFSYCDANTGHQGSRDGMDTLVPSRFSIDKEDNEPDASKKELLRAMEARLNALHQEQNMAFSRANAAGFDNSNISYLMTFAEHFGADRLLDACAHFVSLLHKKTALKGGQEFTNSPIFETPSDVSAYAFGTIQVSREEASLQSAKRKLDFEANKTQATKFGEMKGADPAKRGLGQKGGSTISTPDQSAEVVRSGMFLARLQQMAQQVDARSKEDFGWQIDGEKELSLQGSENDADNAFQNKLSKASWRERSNSLPALRVRTEGSPKQSTSLVEAGTSKEEDEASKGKDSARIAEGTSHAETDKSKGTQGDAPARRLSVQAAISLFESKKKDSNEPPFRKLTKQESRKTLSESGNSPSEKSVLKRWSGQTPCSPEANNVQDKKVLESRGLEVQQDFDSVNVEAHNVPSSQKEVDNPPDARPDEQARENFKKSLSSLLQHDNAQHLEKSSKSRSIDVNVPHVSPPIQQPLNSIGGSNMRPDHKNVPSLPQNFLTAKVLEEKSEVEHANKVTPAKLNFKKKPTTEVESFSEVKPDEFSPSRASIGYNAKPEQAHGDKEMLKTHNAKELLPKPSQPVPHRSQIPSQVPSVTSFEREYVGTLAAAVSESEQILERRTDAVKPKEVPAVDRPTGRNTSFGKMSVQKKVSSIKELPTNLLTSSMDFHMQALVQMVEHQYTNLSFNGVEIANEQRGEQRGRFYDHYAKLREAKMRGEHPAKRAEREAKLKSMQETLERRKAEMESKVVRLSRRKVHNVRAVDPGAEMPRNSGLTAAMVEQKDLKDDDDDTNQEEYSLKSQDQVLDYSNPTSPASTPHLSKSQSSSLMLRAATKAAPTLSKSVSSSRISARGGASSVKPAPKNPGAPNQGKPSNLSTSSADTVALKSAPNVKDVARSSLIRIGGSARVHPRLNVSPNEATALVDDRSNIATPGNVEKKEPRHQPLLVRKNVSSIAVSRSFPTDAEMLLGSPRGQQEGATDALDSRTQQNSGATQEARPFLRKGRGIGPGVGPGIIKQKASILVESFKNSDEDPSTDCKEDEVYAEFEDIKSTQENSLEVFDANDIRVVQDQDSSSSGVESIPTVHDESTSPSSRPSTGQTDRGEGEASDDFPSSNSENEKFVPDTATSYDETERIGSAGAVESAPQGSFVQVVNLKQKEGTLMLSDLLSQKNSDSASNTVGYVSSSVSFREASLLPHGQMGSPFPASVSQPYSSMLQRGTVSSRFSPPRADLPSSVPALWNVPQSGKYMQGEELVHSGRRLTGHQKQASMLPLPPKEPSKGFKRLLHFGRKSRTLETTTDCVSVSTTSEGDDDADDVRETGSQLSDELSQKLRMQRRGSDYGNMGDHVSFNDQDTSQFFGSAIPPPPANFRLREEHLAGGNLIKAPRSFFSLSSFRSKGSEGKSR